MLIKTFLLLQYTNTPAIIGRARDEMRVKWVQDRIWGQQQNIDTKFSYTAFADIKQYIIQTNILHQYTSHNNHNLVCMNYELKKIT